MDLKAIERSIAAHTNRERRKRGLRRVQPKRNMNAAARSHSQQMAKVGKLAHEGIGDGTPASRALEFQCGKEFWSENCQGPWSRQYLEHYKTTAEALGKKAVENWMSSPPHRQNLLDHQWVAMGVGAGQNLDGGIYLTQTFGPTERMLDEKVVALCAKCKNQNIRTRTRPHEKNLWRCLKCKQVFPTPRRAYRRPGKRHILAKDISRLESGVRINNFLPQLPTSAQRGATQPLGATVLVKAVTKWLSGRTKPLRTK
jgi:ribosomal protein L37AE/L43A